MSNSLTYLGATYTDNNIVSGSYSKSESLNMAELPVDTVKLTLRPNLHLDFFTHEPFPMFTRDGKRFKTSEANPLAGQFQQNTPIVQYRDGSQTAIWYLQSIERISSDAYELNGISSLGRLTQRTHYGGIYNGVQAHVILADIMGDIPYYVDDVFKTVLVYGWLPIATARDNLQQILFALGANLKTAADGTLRVENLSTEPVSAIIDASKIYSAGASVKYDTPVTKIVVLEHQYLLGNETRQLFEGAATGNQTITFSEPMSNLSATGLTIVESGANYAVVSGTGTLIGSPYIHTTREIVRNVTNANVENVIRVENATLVGLTASADVANRLAEYYTYRDVVNVSVASAFCDVGDIASVFDPFDRIMRNAAIEECQVSLSATTKSTISARIGYVPWQQIPFEDEYIVLPQSGTYTFPSDIQASTEVTVILIGGGQGGYNGSNGANGGSDSASARIKKNEGGSVSISAKSGGAGGAGGTRGAGGKIYRVSIIVNPSSSFSVVIGAGGSVNGGVGGDTTFGNYSSALGASSDGGFYDIKNRRAYALPGSDGVAGANGGRGASGGGTGARGDSIGAYSGGYGGNGESDSMIGESYSIGGGGGGGACSGRRGLNAPDVYLTNPSSSTAVWHTDGGAGASPTPKTASTIYGCGGDGGDGGGGGGGCGGGSDNFNSEIDISGTVTISGVGGSGGIGGSGGVGAPGCVILIFRRPAQQ